MDESKIITQLSIFVNNEPGRLANVCKIIKSVGIKNPDDSFEKLREKGIIIRKTDIIAIAVTDAADSFFEAADVLGNAGVNIEYGYFYTGVSDSVLFVRVDDTEKAVDILEKAGIRLLDDAEI